MHKQKVVQWRVNEVNASVHEQGSGRIDTRFGLSAPRKLPGRSMAGSM
jgi:hypothetical protein